MFGVNICRRFSVSATNCGRLVALIESELSNHATSKDLKKLNLSRLKKKDFESRRVTVTLEPSSITTFKLPTEDENNQDVSIFRPSGSPPLTMTIDLKSLQETSLEVSEKIKTMESFITKHDSFGKIHQEEEEKPINTISDIMWRKVDHYEGKTSAFIKDVYLPLGKFRLSALVVMTAMEGYGMAPSAFAFDSVVFSSLLIGTSLTSVAANSINQILESPYDAQMNRTKNRPLASGKISPLHAATFAATTACSGVALLWFGTTPVTAALGFANILLYTSVYTPMKRLSIANTWIGSIVGAIPPMMGWAACTGTLDPGAFVLGGFLYCWQFPHFNALSWNLRAEYSRAGYRMSSVLNPAMCRRVCLRHSIAMLPLSVLAPYLDMTSWWFVADSLPFNLYLIYLSYNFYKDGSSNSSKKLFRFSLVHIPVILLLMILSKSRKPAPLEEGVSE